MRLRSSDWVRVRSRDEILATLDEQGRLDGMTNGLRKLERTVHLDGNNKTRGYFDAEHVPYCGKEFSVRSLVNRIIDERTGYMAPGEPSARRGHKQSPLSARPQAADQAEPHPTRYLGPVLQELSPSSR